MEDIPQARENASWPPGKFSANEFRVTELSLLTAQQHTAQHVPPAEKYPFKRVPTFR
jgi:hypothetical protein